MCTSSLTGFRDKQQKLNTESAEPLLGMTTYLHPQVPSLSEVALPLFKQTPAMPGGCMLIVGHQGSIKQLQNNTCVSTTP